MRRYEPQESDGQSALNIQHVVRKLRCTCSSQNNNAFNSWYQYFKVFWFDFAFLKCSERWIFHLGASCNLPVLYSTVKSPEVKHSGSLRITTLISCPKTWYICMRFNPYIHGNDLIMNDLLQKQQHYLYITYIFYSYFQSLLHMNQKATFIFSLWGKVIGKSKPTRSAGWILLSVCVHTHCRYTQHILTVYLSHV